MSYFNEIISKFDPSNMSAFGTLEADSLNPVFQGDFVYGLNTQMWNAPVTNAGASVTPTAAAMGTPESGARLKISSGVTNGAYAYVTSRKISRYRAGQGQVLRFTPIFTTGVASNVQFWGMGTIASNAIYDGYGIGYNGTALSIFHYVRGAAASGFPLAQASWNGDKMDGAAGSSFTWNPQLGTPFMIKYPYLGYGDIEFYAQNPTTTRWVLVHTIRYANTIISTQLSNPSLQFVGFTANSAGTGGSVDMYCGSVAMFISGERSFAGNPKWAADSSGMVTQGTGVKTIGTSESCILNIRNCTTYNGITNRGAIRLNSMSVSNTSNTNLIVRLLIGATFTTTPVYTPVNGTTGDNGVTLTAANSIASVDVAGTTITSLANRGIYLFNMSIGQTGQEIIDLTPFDIYINPTEVLTIGGTGSANSNVTCSLNWSEDI